MYRILLPQPQKYATTCHSPVRGSRFGCALNGCSSVPEKFDGPTVSSSSVSSTGGDPASTIAYVFPAIETTLVFAAKLGTPSA